MSDYFSTDFTLGILGGGQLGKMLLQQTRRLDIRTAVLDPAPDSPCKGLANIFTEGSLNNYETVYQFGKQCDVLTIEIEHVNVEALQQLELEGVKVFPSSSILKTIQNKRIQKEFYLSHDIPTSPFTGFYSKSEIDPKTISFPIVFKSAKEGYDGRGVQILKSVAEWKAIPEGEGILENFVEGAKEIAVIVARRPTGETACFPSVEMDFHPIANLVEFLFSPSSLTESEEAKAKEIAMNVADAFSLTGIMAVEMFVTQSGEILVNESAPRPHNSGHQTIEGCYTSQYEQHLRAILDLPLGSTHSRSAAVMVNLLGEPNHFGEALYEGIREVMALEGVYVHIYGKKDTRPFRKMGHVTIISDDLASAKEKAIFVKQHLKVKSCKVHS